jgi:LysM repeat protein
MRNLSRYTVTFTSGAFPDVVALLDETPEQITGGDGGWQVTSRERRIGLTQWRGNDPVRLAIPILFDSSIGSIADQSLSMRNLQLLGRPPTINTGQPPVLQVVSKGIRYPTSQGAKQDWVIENLQWGTNVMKDTDPFRQDCVVNLLQYIDEDRVAFANIDLPSISKHKKKKKTDPNAKERKKTAHGWPKFYTVQQGDTLPKIAAKFYKDSSLWRRIAKANNIRDPKMLLPLEVLIIPAP